MKLITHDRKIEAAEGLDGKYHLEIEFTHIGTIHIIGDTVCDCISQLLDILAKEAE